MEHPSQDRVETGSVGADDDVPTKGPGWGDWTTDDGGKPVGVPWEGPPNGDVIHTGRYAARAGWWRVICSQIGPNGGTLNDLQGRMGWFLLSMTRREAKCVMDAAKRKKLIEPEGPLGTDGLEIAGPDRKWVLTDRGEKYTTEPRGAGSRDFMPRLVPKLREAYGVAKGAVEIVGFLGVSGLLAQALSSETLLWELALVGGLWLWVFLLAWAALADERVLTAMAKSWPRLEAYRPIRYEFETSRARTPFPFAMLSAATIVAALIVVWRLRDHEVIGEWVWVPALLVATLLAAATIGWYRKRKEVSSYWHGAFNAEARRRNRP